MIRCAFNRRPSPSEQHQKSTGIDALVRALIRVHNHPSGDPTPTQADIQMTKAIVDIAIPFGVSVHDHIIVGNNGHASLKGMRLI